MNRRTTVRAVLLLLATAVCMPASRAQSELPIDGTYTFIPERSDDVRAAIDALVAKMNFIIRPIARSRLSKTNIPYKRIVLARAGGDLDITFDERKPLRLPADGTVIKGMIQGDEVFDASLVRRGAQLVQTYQGSDGSRVNTYRWDETGNTLFLDVTVASEQLPHPLKYTLAYRRVP